MDNDDIKEAEEAAKLVQGLLHYIRSNQKLIDLVAKLVNVYGIKDLEVRTELQRAFNESNEGKKLLEEIGLFETLQ